MDTIRKYLSTPKIIPVVSVDTAQIYSLIKNKHYSYFGYSANTIKHDIKDENELNFLKTLPEEYLQKILKPTRKVVLMDMYELYKKNNNTNEETIQIKFQSHEHNFLLYFNNALWAYINILYGRYISNMKDINDFNLLNYLKDKAFRSFYEDMTAFLNGFQKDSNGKGILYSRDKLKERLLPMYIDHFDNQYDSIVWFWDKYLSILNQKINIYINNKINRPNSNFYINILNKVLYIDSFSDMRFMREEQVYARLYMQDLFTKDIIISIKNEKNKDDKIIKDIEKITKTIAIDGMVELITRIMIPAHIFEKLINFEIVDIFKYNTEELRTFGRNNNNTLQDSMFSLSTSILKYFHDSFYNSKKEKNCNYNSKESYCYNSNKKFIGVCVDKKYKDLFPKYALFIENYVDIKAYKDIYFLSPLKFYSLLPDYFKYIKEERMHELVTMIQNISKKYKSSITNQVYGFAYPLLLKEDIEIVFENSNIGVTTIDEFSNDLVQNILKISITNHDDSFLRFIDNMNDTKYSFFIDKQISTYKTMFLNHIILFLSKKVDNTFYNHLDIDYRYITSGSSINDVKKYKMKENSFATNSKNILKNIKKEYQNDKKYEQIERFIIRLYLTIIKNKAYLNSFYIVEDKDFNIKEYIKNYKEQREEYEKEREERERKAYDIDLIKKHYQDTMKELDDLNNNLSKIYKEGEFLRCLDEIRYKYPSFEPLFFMIHSYLNTSREKENKDYIADINIDFIKNHLEKVIDIVIDILSIKEDLNNIVHSITENSNTLDISDIKKIKLYINDDANKIHSDTKEKIIRYLDKYADKITISDIEKIKKYLDEDSKEVQINEEYCKEFHTYLLKIWQEVSKELKKLDEK
jgi:predicted Zn-ribbon and HTH transcriptional regulator